MRKTILALALGIFVAATALAHGGHSHLILGTVKKIENNRVVITKKDGKEVTVLLSGKTRFSKADKNAKRADLVVGVRVSVQLGEDSKTATTVKIGTKKSK